MKNIFKLFRDSKSLFVHIIELIAFNIIILCLLVSGVSAATGVITLNSSTGSVGASVSVNGSGFTPNSAYSINFGTTPISSGILDASGNVAGSFVVPSVPGGQYAITVTTLTDNSNIAYYTVTPAITLSASSGRSGGQISISGTGFRASSYVNIMLDTTLMATVTTVVNGSFSNVTVNIPAGSKGDHTISANDSVNPVASISFTITEPAISINPTNGYIGDQIYIVGSGFKSNDKVSIYFDAVIIGTTTADSTGSFPALTANVPASAVSTLHTVSGKDSFGTSQGISFAIKEPQISLSQQTGKVGDAIRVSGLGFSPGPVTFTFDNTDSSSTTAGTDGRFTDAVFNIPPSFEGIHTIAARDYNNISDGILFEIAGVVNIIPNSGTPGDQINIIGSGLAKDTPVQLELNGRVIVINASTDSLGNLRGIFEIPSVAGGEQKIIIKDVNGNTKSVTLNVTPRITVDPATGAPGDVVKIFGAGFHAGTAVTVNYDGTPVVTLPAAIVTDKTGSFNASCQIPALLPGSYNLEASDSDSSAVFTFNSIFTATISQETSQDSPGFVGMQLTINGVGFKPNARVTISRSTTQEVLTAISTNASGEFSTTFTLPPSVAGSHTVIITDGTNTKTFDFYIEREPPNTPVLLKPGIAEKVKRPLVFDWEDVSDPSGVSYVLQISRDDKFTEILFERKNITQSTFTLPKDSGLESVTTENPYYWRVKAVDGASNESLWSPPKNFSLGFVFTLPNGERDLILLAWQVYVFSAVVLLLIIVSFLLGRRFSRKSIKK